VFYYALVFRRCHFSYYCYFTSRWVSCFCFICFSLVVSRIPARFLYFCRDCWWFFLKCHFCSHEVAVVSESHRHLRSFCSVLFVNLRFWAYEISRVGILWRLFDGSKLGIEPYSAAFAAVGQQRDSDFQNFLLCFFFEVVTTTNLSRIAFDLVNVVFFKYDNLFQIILFC